MFVHENDRIQGLRLGAGRKTPFRDEVIEKGFDFLFAQLVGVTFVVKQDVLLTPVDVTGSSTWAVMTTMTG